MDTATQTASTPRPKLTIGGKIIFVGKFIIFLATFGFAFPTLLSD